MSRRNRDRRAIAAYLAMCADVVADHKAAQVDVEGRVRCDCHNGVDPATDTPCVICDGTGWIPDVGRVDAEDVE